jgi:hypothetical protein
LAYLSLRDQFPEADEAELRGMLADRLGLPRPRLRRGTPTTVGASGDEPTDR